MGTAAGARIATKEGLERFAAENLDAINAFIDEESEGLPTPLYSSVDIREGRDKVAPIDHNMYPAGFNNVCATDLAACARELARALGALGEPGPRTVGVLAESHTRNGFYLDHLAVLGRTVRDAGFEARLLSLDGALFGEAGSLPLVSASGFDVLLERARVEGGRIVAGGEPVDLAIMNNDQSRPMDVDWDRVRTPVLPTPRAGWFRRDKVRYFSHYARVADRFARRFGIDGRLIQARFAGVAGVDFATREGVEGLASAVDRLKEGLPGEPGVFVKASNGTYGMGISVVRDGGDILRMNRRGRDKMGVVKNNTRVTSVLVQEGIDTVLEHDGMPAEVSIYLIGGKSLGGFLRANGRRGAGENLNSRGAVFKRYCISEIRQADDGRRKEALYSVVARLATLAAALETRDMTGGGGAAGTGPSAG